MSEAGLELVRKWETFTDDILERTEKFPKTSRYSLAARIDNLAIDVLEVLVEAQYTKGDRRSAALHEINLKLSRLRILVRLAHRRRCLAHAGYEHVSAGIDEAGRMLGGWIKTAARGRTKPAHDA